MSLPEVKISVPHVYGTYQPGFQQPGFHQPGRKKQGLAEYLILAVLITLFLGSVTGVVICSVSFNDYRNTQAYKSATCSGQIQTLSIESSGLCKSAVAKTSYTYENRTNLVELYFPEVIFACKDRSETETWVSSLKQSLVFDCLVKNPGIDTRGIRSLYDMSGFGIGLAFSIVMMILAIIAIFQHFRQYRCCCFQC